jgi:hypothetical protein
MSTPGSIPVSVEGRSWISVATTPRAERLYPQALRLQLLVQRLRRRDDMGQRSRVHSPAKWQRFDGRRTAERKHARHAYDCAFASL